MESSPDAAALHSPNDTPAPAETTTTQSPAPSTAPAQTGIWELLRAQGAGAGDERDDTARVLASMRPSIWDAQI